MDVKLNDDELKLLRGVLSQIVIKNRTGEVGIMHGLDRFVSTNIALKKQHRQILASAFQKLGLSNSPRQFEG